MTSGAEHPSSSRQVKPTDVLHMTYDGNWLQECQSHVVSMEKNTKDETVHIVLDRTVMHAQGGGQPTDTGEIVLKNSVTIQVSKVTLDRSTGVVTHAGTMTTPGNAVMLPPLSTVLVRVDSERRRILSECHTAGHVVDAAMERCGKMLKPSKGYHFLDSPYVEYEGVVPPAERETLLADLQQAFCTLVEEDRATEIALVSKDQANAMCNRQAQNFDMDVFSDKNSGQVRVVTVAGFPCPCGGTHVRSTKDLAANLWGITGLKSKKGVVRVKLLLLYASTWLVLTSAF